MNDAAAPTSPDPLHQEDLSLTNGAVLLLLQSLMRIDWTEDITEKVDAGDFAHENLRKFTLNRPDDNSKDFEPWSFEEVKISTKEADREICRKCLKHCYKLMRNSHHLSRLLRTFKIVK